MKLKLVAFMLALFMVLALPLMAVAEAGGNFTSVKYQPGWSIESNPSLYDLGRGNDYIPIGTVEVWDDGLTMFIKYKITENGWWLTSTAICVADDTTELRTNPGQFAKNKGSSAWDPGYYGAASGALSGNITTYQFEVPLSYFNDGLLLIAAHASIGNNLGIGDQTAWAHGLGGDPGDPLPELPAVALLGLGLSGMVTLVFFKRRQSHSIRI